MAALLATANTPSRGERYEYVVDATRRGKAELEKRAFSNGTVNEPDSDRDSARRARARTWSIRARPWMRTPTVSTAYPFPAFFLFPDERLGFPDTDSSATLAASLSGRAYTQTSPLTVIWRFPPGAAARNPFFFIALLAV